MSAVEVPVAAVVAAVRAAVESRSPDGTPSFQAGVEAAAPVIVSELVDGLLGAFRIHTEVPRAMGREDFVKGIEHCIKHLEAYKVLVDREVGS